MASIISYMLFAKFYSFKNQRLTQIKNETPSLMLSHFFRIIVKEIVAWAYVLLFEKYALKAIKKLIKQFPRALKKEKLL